MRQAKARKCGPARVAASHSSSRPRRRKRAAQAKLCSRTFGWLGRWRRTNKDDVYLPATSAYGIYLAMIRIMLRRLAES